MVRGLLGLVGVAMAAACSNADSFVCSADGQCGNGTCEASGYCSFPDDECPSGQRYGGLAGSLSGLCVDEGTATEPGNPSTSDGSTTTGAGSTRPELDGGSSSSSSSSTTGDPQTSTTAGLGCADDDGWWNCDWGRRIALQVAPPQTADPMVEVPIALVLDASRIDYDLAGPNGRDLRIVTAEGATTPIEIENWDEGGTSVVWFGLDLLTPGRSTPVWLYFNNPNARPAGTGQDVWDDSYRAVWHLQNPSLADSTGNIANCIDLGVDPGLGLLDLGVMPQFGGWVDCGVDGLAELFVGGGTITVWVNPNDSGGNAFGRILDKSTSTSPEGYNLATNDGQRIHFARGHSEGLGRWRTPNGSVPYGQWSFVALRYTDGMLDQPDIFIDGVSQGLVVASESLGVTLAEDSIPLAIGNFAGDGTRTYSGVIDELRLSDGYRSTEWMDYQQAVARDLVVSYGKIEASR